MLSMGGYPPGVTDADIDRYFGDDGSCCKYCWHYCNGDSSCSRKEYALSAEEQEQMTQEEFDEAIHTDEDDYCDDFEWRDDEPEYEEEWYDE